MTLAQKLTLAGVALVCIVLIIAFSPDPTQRAGDPRSGGRAGEPLAVVDRNIANDSGHHGPRATPLAGGPHATRPTAQAPAIASDAPPAPPTGYDALLARIREVEQGRDAARPAPAEGDVPPVAPAPPLTAPSPLASDPPPPATTSTDPAAAPPLPAAESSSHATPAPAAATDPIGDSSPNPTSVPTLTIGPRPDTAGAATDDKQAHRDEPGKPSDDILNQVADLPLADDPPALPDAAKVGSLDEQPAALATSQQPDRPVAPAAANAIANKPAAAAANATTGLNARQPAADLPPALTALVPKPAAAASDDVRPAATPVAPANPASNAITNAANGRTYIVQPGDTFSSIATTVYGAERHWIDIAEANGDIDPKKLKAGMVIKLPELPTDSPRPAAAPPAKAVDAKPADAKAAFTPTIHEVKAGENLSAISKQYFNTADHWRHIYLTNRQAIGSDPGKLKLGMKLKITAPAKD
jgi:nucleoid-associated protein YgaU